MDAWKFGGYGIALAGLVLVCGCTAPRTSTVAIEPTFSYHRDQPGLTYDDLWPADPAPLAEGPAFDRLEPTGPADHPPFDGLLWPHTP